MLPIIARYHAAIPAAESERIAGRARKLVAGDPKIAATVDFAGGVLPGTVPGAGLCYEDHAPIGLAVAGEAVRYEYRMRSLAGTGDALLIAGPAHPEFDAYCRDVVGLGAPRMLRAPAGQSPRAMALAQRCAQDRAQLARLAALAREAGGLTLHPYACGGHDWLLASAVAMAARVPVRVAGPPPGVARRVNDKAWFAEQVSWLLGRRAVPPGFTVLGPAALAGRIALLARRYPRVVIKVPDSAGGRGNLVLDAAMLRGMPLKAMHRRLRRLLRALGWRDVFPLVAGVWESPVVASPSAQLWLPKPFDGPPLIEGLFMQMLSGDEGEFIGAEPARLPAEVEARMVDEAARIGALFQGLGYFGRCSLDAVLVGDRIEAADLHWIECNGRWGGVSIPLMLVNRLVPDAARRFVIVQQVDIERPPCAFGEALERVSPMLYDPRRQQRGIVFLSPRLIENGTGMHYVSIADTLEQARAQAHAAAERLAA